MTLSRIAGEGGEQREPGEGIVSRTTLTLHALGAGPSLSRDAGEGPCRYRFSNTSLAICAAVIAAGQPA
jgi:hypothetical protein